MSVLVAFFSRAGENYFGGEIRSIEIGNTEIVCGKISELIEADTFKIEMKEPYADEYMACVEAAKKDWKENARPELVSMPESIAKYDTIILAYPNYCSTIPMPVATFLENYDFTGKTILPLCTNEGSGMGTSENYIKKCAKGASIKKGLPVNGSRAEDSKAEVEKWLKENGLLD